jgi:flagellar biosynthetic protein FliP
MARVAAAAPAPLLPDLSQRLHPSDSTPWTILVVLTLITLLPAILMAMTPLVRLLVVFHFLRQALGTQTAPSNPTLLGLALMMTWFLMTPVLSQVDQQAVEPYRAGQITGMEAIDRGSMPVKHFLLRYAREKDLALFTAAGQVARPNTPHEQNHSCSDRDELEAQRFGLFAETLFISLSLFFTFLKEHAFIVGLAGG